MTTQISNPFSTGGGGVNFEVDIQASFVALMLTGGHAPCLPCWPIKEIKLQGKIDGYNTDDFIVFVENSQTQERRKLLGQAKHSINITKADLIFSKVIQDAWKDFNDPRVFTKTKDVIALITGPVNRTDSRNVLWLLDQARHTKDIDEFYRHVDQANFAPTKSKEKLDVIRHHLKLANNGKISKEELYDFLNHFYVLGYDLGKEFGVILSFLYSHISQFKQNPQEILSRIVDIVRVWNQDAGTIILEKLPEDLKESFKQPIAKQIPEEFIQPESQQIEIDWNQHQYSTDLVLANLIGSWNEKSDGDIEAISILSTSFKKNYEDWISNIREVLQHPNTPISVHNGIWNITERDPLWKTLGPRIFDQDLDAFKEFAVTALTERDPAFELPREERYAAVIHKKVLTRSTALRKGLANSLALLGNRSEVLVNCMSGKAKETAHLVIREIFVNADWVLWGSLNRLLPALAEAAPNEFLSAVEDSLNSDSCPFDKLFSQEGNGSTGRNYLTELLWALETLAWDKNYLVQVCLILGKLASRDPGGNWGNRPVNSLSTILLPWFPQTIAPIEKHRAAVQTLCKEQPEVAWELIISLLPNQDQMSVGSHKPLWRDTIPDDWEERVTIQEYWDQVSFYSELAVSIAENDTVKLRELIDHFDKLYEQAGNKFIEILSSYPISSLPQDERLPLWNGLTKFISWHRRFPDAKWSLNDERLSSLEAVAKKLSPSNIENLYQPLFSNRDFDFYEESDSWEEKERKLSERRQKSVQNILKSSGIKSVIQFAKSVESPKEVGHSLGCVTVGENDAFLLPEYLGTENDKLSAFVNGYIWGRYKTIGWSWVDKIDKSDWNSDQIAELLSYLPFTKEAWERAADWLEDSQGDYWLKTNASPYQVDSDLSIAIDKLIDYGRSHAAIRCLYSIHHSSQLIDVNQCVKALFAALSSEESYHSSDIHYYIAELITMLQESEEVAQNDLLHIEWGYLSLLKHYQGFRPKLLENRLTSDPEFFCDKLHLMYRSKKIDVGTSRLSEKAQRIATDVWRLFHNWRIPPGLQEDGGFDSSHFLSWLQSVKDICAESGHLEVALTEIGKILIYCPPDPCGLWINRTVADALNATDAEDMRKGFQVGILNSRGVYEVDPTGKPERELAKKYQEKADNVENAGYYRLAVTLRDVSESYDQYAEHIVSRYGEGEI